MTGIDLCVNKCKQSGPYLKHLVYNKLHVKKVTIVQALRLCTGRTAHRGSRGIALPFHDHDTRIDKGSASRPGRSLPPGKTSVFICTLVKCYKYKPIVTMH